MILTVEPSMADGVQRERSNWYYEKAELRKTKSFEDGISYETELRYRREAARFIIKLGTQMNLRYDTMATGVVYMHRFYMCHSFNTFPRFVTACCCLFLAGKVEETPKKCKDIIKNAKAFLTESQMATFNDDPKEEMLTLERILLQTINFDLQVDHPYQYILKYAKVLKGDRDILQKMVQMAWTFVNDSLCTTICLQWEPEIIAIALMFLAGKLSKFEVTDWEGKTPRQKKWWDMFVDDMSIEILEDICHQVLDLYSTNVSDQPKDSPPTSPASARPSLAIPGTGMPGLPGIRPPINKNLLPNPAANKPTVGQQFPPGAGGLPAQAFRYQLPGHMPPPVVGPVGGPPPMGLPGHPPPVPPGPPPAPPVPNAFFSTLPNVRGPFTGPNSTNLPPPPMPPVPPQPPSQNYPPPPLNTYYKG